MNWSIRTPACCFRSTTQTFLCSRKFTVRGSCSGAAQGVGAGEWRRSVSCLEGAWKHTGCAWFQTRSDTALLNLGGSSCSSWFRSLLTSHISRELLNHLCVLANTRYWVYSNFKGVQAHRAVDLPRFFFLLTETLSFGRVQQKKQQLHPQKGEKNPPQVQQFLGKGDK